MKSMVQFCIVDQLARQCCIARSLRGVNKMTVKECYDLMGGDYDDVVNRLMNDKMIERFLPKVVNDQSYALLCNSLEEKNMKESFRAAHTLKGICQNMSLTRLRDSVSLLTEQLRDREEYGEDILPLAAQVKEDYLHTCECIRRFLKEE